MVRLLARAQQGDRRALEELFCWHLPQLRRWAFGAVPAWMRRSGETDDLVQRTALNALRRLKHLDVDQEDQLQGYLRRSLVNLIRDEHRRAKREPGRTPIDDELIASTPSPQRRALARAEMRRYEAALTRLSPANRAAIRGRFEMGLDYAQLARRLRRPTAGAARQAVGRALEALHREMRRV
jgi:RNA polymerase sigma factor (sigma-70 family)